MTLKIWQNYYKILIYQKKIGIALFETDLHYLKMSLKITLKVK